MENQPQETPPVLQKLPNATLTLVFGILSIVCCGPIASIVALIVSAKSNTLLKENPNGYSDAGNHKAGRICAWIGLALGVIGGIIYLIALIFTMAA